MFGMLVMLYATLKKLQSPVRKKEAEGGRCKIRGGKKWQRSLAYLERALGRSHRIGKKKSASGVIPQKPGWGEIAMSEFFETFKVKK